MLKIFSVSLHAFAKIRFYFCIILCFFKIILLEWLRESFIYFIHVHWKTIMDLSKLSSGKDVPNDVNVIIEIPKGSKVKYEVDKESGAIFVDRVVFTPMAYPAAYGFVPNTLAEDGDPIDMLVLCPEPIIPGAVIRSRPIGVLKMEDESGMDEKIICVPHDKIHPFYSKINEVEELPEIVKQEIEHFFTHYKDLEKGKWVKILGWDNRQAAHKLINNSVKKYKE